MRYIAAEDMKRTMPFTIFGVVFDLCGEGVKLVA